MTGRNFTAGDGWHGTCPETGKRMYANRKLARRAARLMHDPTLAAYSCPHAPEGAPHHHVGHLLGSIVRGSKARMRRPL